MQKSVVSFIILALNGLVLCAQDTYSYRFDFGFPAAVLTSILSTDSCYYATGVIADSVPPYEAGNIFVKLSLQGEIDYLKTIRDTAKSYQTWRNNLRALPWGGFAVAGYTVDSLMKALLIVYDRDGDMVNTAEFPNPYYPDEGFILTRDMDIVEDGFALLNLIVSSQGINNDEIQVLRLNIEGEVLWEKEYGIISRDDTPNNVICLPDGYIIASIRDNTNFAHQNIEARNHIFKVNEQGEVLWEYFSPIGELRGKEGRAIATTDGGLLVLTGQGVEVPAGPGFSQLRWHNYAFKLGSSRQEEWGVLVRDSLPSVSYYNQLTSGIEIQDGSGYAVAGNLIARTSENWFFSGVLAKISPDGELLWKRYYQHIVGEGPRHYINDLAQAPGGGFIMAGEVRDTVNAPRQQGWLLKVDEYGCLVPGCELVSGVEEEKSSDDSKSSDDCTLLLYPNPVAEALQVYFTAPAGGEHHFRILDAQGREWRRFPPASRR